MFVFIKNKVNLDSLIWKTLPNQTELNVKGGQKDCHTALSLPYQPQNIRGKPRAQEGKGTHALPCSPLGEGSFQPC